MIGLQQIDNKTWATTEDYIFTFKDDCQICIPKNYTFDWATIPRLLWPFVGKHELGVVGPLVHDYLYEHKGLVHIIGGHFKAYTRKDADLMFLDKMRETGINRVLRNLAYLAVRQFGWIYWYT